MLTIGIPRALHYYKYYPLWYSFFNDLGFQVITSPPTCKTCLDEGSIRLISDTCLPVKAYVGHVLSLKDKCDLVFVPVIRSLEKKVHNCSRFLGLPDLVKSVVPEMSNLLEIEIDVNKGDKFLKKQMQHLRLALNVDSGNFERSSQKAIQTYLKFLAVLRKRQLTYQEGINLLYDQKEPPHRIAQPPEFKIGITGHPYVTNDEYINHNLIQRIRKFKVEVITPEMISRRSLQKGIQTISEHSYWTSESEVIGAVGSYLENKLDGIIGVTAFSCGPDSLMMHLAERKADANGLTPFLALTLEEHSSETGLVTRLEAFLEMVSRRKRNVRL